MQNDDYEVLFYTVKNNDTLYMIADKFNIPLELLQKLNNIYSDELEVGKLIKIPFLNNFEYMTYTVMPGDSLWQISRRFNTTVEEIMKLNNLNNDNILIGSILKVPRKKYIYTVKYGDSLWQIARKFNTTVDEIKRINNLHSDNIYIGEELKIM